MTYRSKVDPWMGILVAGVPAVLVLAAVAASAGNGDAIASWLGVGLVVILYVTVVWPIEYHLTDGELAVRSGLVRRRIPYAEMARVTATRNPLAAPALSLDRLRIDRSGGSYLLISPRDRDTFIAALRQHAPHVVFET